jgi:hypothetical protein
MKTRITFLVERQGPRGSDWFVPSTGNDLTAKEKYAAVIEWLANNYLTEMKELATELDRDDPLEEGPRTVADMHEANCDGTEFPWDNDVLAAIARLLGNDPDAPAENVDPVEFTEHVHGRGSVDAMGRPKQETSRAELEEELRELYGISILTRNDERRIKVICQQLQNCICRKCGKHYNEQKARGDYKGFCSAKCQHAKAHACGYRKSRMTNPTEYEALHRAGQIGSVYVIK